MDRVGLRRRLMAVVVGLVWTYGVGHLSAQQTVDGWINEWLIYPPILSGSGAAPGDEFIRLDYITDGDQVFESTMLPTDAFEVEPDYFGASAGQGLADPFAFPEFAVQFSADDTMNFDTIFGAATNCVVYSVVYVNNPQDTPINAVVELGSDDAVQVKVDDCEVHINNADRGFGNPGEVQDRASLILTPGAHRLLVKIFQGGGGYGFRLRFANEETGEPLSPDSDPAIELGLDPDDFGLESIEPGGIALRRTIDPKFVARLAEDNRSTITLTGSRTFPDLDGTTPVVVTEVLPDGITLVNGTAAPPPTRVDGQTLVWELEAGELEADGIEYELEVDQPGDYDVTGTYTVGEACTAATGGSSRIIAKSLAGILLGDVVGGGDGLGDPPPFKGINIDNGEFMDQATVDGMDFGTSEVDDPSENLNPSPVLDSDVINCVFFMNQEQPGGELDTDEMFLSLDEDGNPQVPYKFIDGDSTGVSWNGILSNNTHDRDKVTADNRTVFVGGDDAFATGVGVHASAGITFDLAAMREEYGEDRIDLVTGVVGMDQCSCGVTPTTNLYIIFSDDDGVVPIDEPQDPAVNPHDQDVFLMFEVQRTQGSLVSLRIPEEASYMTFATGRANADNCCDHGVFGDMRIVSENDLLSPPANLSCSVTDDGLELAWEHAGNKDEPFEITAGGRAIGSVPGDSLSTTVAFGSLPLGVLEISVSNSQGSTSCGFVNANEVHVNCGGPRLEDFVDGRTWEEDTSSSPSMFLVSGANTANFAAGFNPDFPDGQADTSLVEPDFTDDPSGSRLFATERWADGDVIYRMLTREGDYEVTLLFAEGCCSDGCEDIPDPALSLTNCRVFDIELNGTIVADQFAQHVEASVAAGIGLPNSSWGIALAKGPYRLEGVSEIEVAIRDLGGGNPPENASIKGISIVRVDVSGASRKPGDVNGDGNFNISDAVAHLNFLFGDARPADCYLVPDSDPPELTPAGHAILDFNGDGSSNISDAVGALGSLFGGGGAHVLGVDCAVVPGDCESNCQ